MTLQTVAVLAALLVSVVSLGGTALRVHGKWDATNGKVDTTNALLRSLIREVAQNEQQHGLVHGRMDARTDRLEGLFMDHVGRHRRI